ncbi:MAG TPA: aminoglycoside adenylyltransferase domain-containing protein [Frankiaceae bacterium]|nr:aminoglycoside adenylyltransferase domain-containing protein [Frankiaceae bacterium]
MITPFPELDAILTDLDRTVRGILGDTYVGCYLEGSFALGAGDAESDADFVVVTTVAPAGAAEAALRRLHDEIPSRPGIWNRNIEGSYAHLDSLRDNARVGEPWLYNDRGHRELVWDAHCNTLHTRWVLRHHGIVLGGPPPADVVADVPEEALRAAARSALPGTLDGIREWADMDHAWTQRYIVQTYCRVLYTAATGRVASKPAALRWAHDHLDPSWRPLLAQVAADRLSPWQPVDPPRPGSMRRAYEFAAYAASWPPGGWD